MAGIMLAGSAFSTASATKVSSEQFKGAITENVLSINDLKETLKGAGLTWNGVIELTDNVTLATTDSENNPKQYVIIKDKDVVLTSWGDEKKEFTGRIVVANENVTISNLKLKHNVIANAWAGFANNTGIAVFADKVTLTGNEISGTVAGDNNVANGITLYPQNSEVNYTITGNKLSGFNKTVTGDGAPGGAWYGSAIQLYQGVKVGSGDNSFPTGLTVNGLSDDKKTAVLKNAAAIAAAIKGGNNTFEGNAADIFVRKGKSCYQLCRYIR